MPIINDQELIGEKEEKPIVEVGEIKEEKEELPPQIKMLEEIEGNFKIMSSVPTHTPRTLKESVILYLSGTTYRLYWFIKDAWKKIYDSTIQVLTFVELAPSSLYKTQVDNDDWEDWDLSSVIPANAYAVEVNVYTDVSGNAGCRKNGTSITRYTYNIAHAGWLTFTVLLDSGRIIETYNTNITDVAFEVTGYWS